MKFTKKVIKFYGKQILKKVIKKSNGEASLIYREDKTYFKGYSKKAGKVTEKCIEDLILSTKKEKEDIDDKFIMDMILELLLESDIPVIYEETDNLA